MDPTKKFPECHGCLEPVDVVFKQIEKKKIECYGLCSDCPHKKRLFEQSDNKLSCSTCKKTFDDCISSKKVGCIDCYISFKEGLFEHFKKVNVSEFTQGTAQKDHDIQELQTSLRLAVASELFEEAAKIRDLLKQLNVQESV